MFPTAQVSALSGADVALYNDVTAPSGSRGAWQSGVTAIKNMLTSLGYSYEEITYTDLNTSTQDFSRLYKVILVPGGYAQWYNYWISLAGKQRIRNFVNAGGGYFGICAGAFFAVDRTIWSGTLYDDGAGLNAYNELTGYDLDLFQGSGTGPINAIADWNTVGYNMATFRFNTTNSVLGSYKTVPYAESILYYGGPYFTPDAGSPVETLATYDYNGLPAIVAFPYGTGRVILSAPHPEIEEDGNADGVTISRESQMSDNGSDWTLTAHMLLWLTARVDRDGDGVYDAEDRYPTDATRYSAWKISHTGFTAAVDSPLVLLGDGSPIWTVNSSNKLQATYYSSSKWLNLSFSSFVSVDKTKGLLADVSWKMVWYVGTDGALYTVYVSGGKWTHSKMANGPFSRLHLVTENNHSVWARKTDGTDVAVYRTSTGRAEAVVPSGSAVAFSGFDSSTASQIGWTANGTLVQRIVSGGKWTARTLPAGGGPGTAAEQADSPYGYDTSWRLYWYGTADGALGWSSLSSNKSGKIHTGKIWPGSPTWVSSAKNWTFCRDGLGTGGKLRVSYYSGGKWLTAPIAAYAGWVGDQAAASSSGRLYFVDPDDGGIKCIYY